MPQCCDDVLFTSFNTIRRNSQVRQCRTEQSPDFSSRRQSSRMSFILSLKRPRRWECRHKDVRKYRHDHFGSYFFGQCVRLCWLTSKFFRKGGTRVSLETTRLRGTLPPLPPSPSQAPLQTSKSDLLAVRPEPGDENRPQRGTPPALLPQPLDLPQCCGDVYPRTTKQK